MRTIYTLRYSCFTALLALLLTACAGTARQAVSTPVTAPTMTLPTLVPSPIPATATPAPPTATAVPATAAPPTATAAPATAAPPTATSAPAAPEAEAAAPAPAAEEPAAPEAEAAAPAPAAEEPAAPAEVSGDPEAGKALFNKPLLGSVAGCMTCHHVDADRGDFTGPNLAGIATRATNRRSGMPAREYLHESITSTNAYIVEGFSEGVMPQNYSEALTEEEINDLIAFLLTLE